MENKQSFLEALRYRFLWEGRQREISDQKGVERKPLSDKELLDLVFQDLGWEDE